MADRLELTSRAESRHFWYRGFRDVVTPLIAQLAGSRRDLRLLDCGCGTGYNLRTLLLPYGRPFGFDLTAEAINRARVYGRPLVRADVTNIPFMQDSFDLAISFDVLQSVQDDTRALRELARVLKPGGHAVINVTAMEFLRGHHSNFWGEFRRYTRSSGTRLAERAGLEVLQISYLFASLVPMIFTVRRAQQLLRRLWTPRADVDLTVPAAPVNAVLSWMVKGEAALAHRVPLPFGSSLLIVVRKP